MPMLDRSKPPRSGAFSKTAFPKYEEFTLDSETPVYLVENHSQPYVSIAIYIASGSTLDIPSTQGLASVTSEMMTKGTQSRSALKIAEEIDFVGGSLSSNAGSDASTVSISVLKRYLSTGVELLCDVLQNASFAEEELDRVKLQRIAGIKHAKSDPGYLADTLFGKMVFADHPYSLEAGGTETSVSRLSPELLKGFYSENFSAKNAFVIAAGDLTSNELRNVLNEKLASWNRNEKKNTPGTGINLQKQNAITLVKKEGAVQSAIRLGHLGIPRNHADYIPTHVMNVLLGGYFNSRINANLRERNGFTYGARSYFDSRKQTGAFLVSTEVRTEVTIRALEEILIEIRKIREEAVTDDELTMVKNYIIGNFPVSIETPQQVAGRLAMIPLYGLERTYYDTFRDKVQALTKAEILRAAETYLHPDAVTISISGDTDAIADELGAFGPVELYNQNFEKIH
jgi:zinc protease